MTSLFKLIGNGDTMTGMTIAVYAFAAIIGIIILVCAIFMIRNYLNARRKSGVQLKSKTADKKKERRKQGLFNYDVIDGNDETEGLDPTDPRNQERNRKKKKHDNTRQVERVGMKAVKAEPQKLTMSNKNTQKVGLRKKTDNAADTANAMNESVMPVSNTEPAIILDDKNYEPDIDFDNTPEPSQPVTPEPSFDDNDYNGFSIEGIPQTHVQPRRPAPMASPEPVEQLPQPQFAAPQQLAMNTQVPMPAQQSVQPQQQPVGRHAAPKHDENPFNAENPFANMIDPSALK